MSARVKILKSANLYRSYLTNKNGTVFMAHNVFSVTLTVKLFNVSLKRVKCAILIFTLKALNMPKCYGEGLHIFLNFSSISADISQKY